MIKAIIILIFTYSIIGCNTTNKKERLFENNQTISLEEAYSNYQFNRKVPLQSKKEPSTVNYSSTVGQNKNIWKMISQSSRLNLRSDRPEVAKQIQYLVKRPTFIKQSSHRARPYLHFIVNQLRQANLPVELAALPFIESGYNPQAVSSAKAEGIWQFIPSTAKIFGLESNYWYDGRRDVIASTQAAILFLKQLNKTFSGDWLLTLAAYNCGPHCVKRSQKRNIKLGKPTDFWSLSLPAETKAYVPRFLAMNKIFRNPEFYGVSLTQVTSKRHFNIIKIDKPLNLKYVAKQLNISTAVFTGLNSGLKQHKIDPKFHRYLLLPVKHTQQFLSLTSSNKKIQPKNLVAVYTSPRKGLQKTRSKKHKNAIEYTVQSGDSLKSIAIKFSVSPQKILSWNKHLNQSKFLRPNQKVMIFQ